METLVINIPESKSALVKQVLIELGVTIEKTKISDKKPSDFAGTLSAEYAKELLNDINQSRKEWERNI